MFSIVQAGRKMVFLNSFLWKCNAIDFNRAQIDSKQYLQCPSCSNFMAIKWLNRTEITLGFGPKNYVFRCASRKENGLFELVFVKVQCNWLWQGTNWAKKTGRKVESTLKRSLYFAAGSSINFFTTMIETSQ